MTKPNKNYLRVSYGEDGNPQVETSCVGLEASKLCVALLAALAAGSDDPAGYLISIVTNAADLLDCVESEEDEDNEEES
jgi:hypothetical protein